MKKQKKLGFAEENVNYEAPAIAQEGDQELECVDCRAKFLFSAGEQKFFTERQFTAPRRCKECRQARKQAKEAEAG